MRLRVWHQRQESSDIIPWSILGDHQIQSINMGQDSLTLEMVLEKNSLVMVEYTARIKDTDKIIETTRSDDGSKMDEPKDRYEPRLVSIGNPAHPVVRGFDAALADAQIDVPQTVEVKPLDAYGEIKRALVRMLTLRKLGENAENASIGDSISVKGKQGVVKFVGSGRVKIDFNHRYAGKTILYDFVVTQKLESPDEIIEALLDEAGFAENESSFSLEDDTLSVEVPDKFYRKENIQNIKFILQIELFQFVPTLHKIEFVESYSNPAKAKTDSDESPPA